MMRQAKDFQDESAALANVMLPLTDAEFEMPTLFKGWTINNILRHLHVWNIAADQSLSNEAAFAEFMGAMAAGVRAGRLPDFEAAYLNGLKGRELAAAWVQQFQDMTARFAVADPKVRVRWVGPSMSVMSSITARLMETWAHGQAIYDALGLVRVDDDRISNIVRLGVNTYGWTFKNRRQEPPGPMPYLCLTAPSGAVWEYGELSDTQQITGSATEFCQVVTQCRNIADTQLVTTGKIATVWMAVAQCFAGPPQTPPDKGLRRRRGN